jgi:DNA-directed RNA polymerase specialized sigma24 family protein
MVTWQWETPRSRPSRQRGSRRPAGAAPREQELGGSEALQETRDLIREAEQALTPDPGQDDAADRLRTDQLVVEAILEEGVGGARHRALEDELIRYAVPVLRHLLADGRLISKAARLGRPVSASGAWLSFTEADREEFAHDMVADALPVFTTAVLENRRWTPAGRASLKTYFVNACILQFARLYARWLRDRQAVRLAGLEIYPYADSLSSPDPASMVVLQDEVSSLLAEMPDKKLRETVVLRAAGYTAADAAQAAGLAPRSAEGKLARFRKNLQEGQPQNRPKAGGQTPRREDGEQSDA